MKGFVEGAVALISHKCLYDYCEAKKLSSTIEPEIFFDMWTKSFMTRVEENVKEQVWKAFFGKIVEARREQ